MASKTRAKKTSRTKAPAKKAARVSAKEPAKKSRTRVMKPIAKRADYGAPIDGYFAKQPESFRKILLRLRQWVEKTMPRAEASLKWGVPFFSLGGKMVCAIAGHKSHVNLILSGPGHIFSDPKKLLQGEAALGRRLVIRGESEVPQAAVVCGWIKAAAAHAAKT